MEIHLYNNIKLDNFHSSKDAIDRILSVWKEKKYCMTNFLYWQNYTLLRNDDDYAEALKTSDFILPDGIGMNIYIRLLLGINITDLNGTDLNPLLIERLKKENTEIAFYGSAAETVEMAAKNAGGVYFYNDGYSQLDWKNMRDNSALLVGLGSPKQEIWIKENLDVIRRKQLLIIGVGGFFEFLSGKRKRASSLIRRMRLEWLQLLPERKLSRTLRNLYIIPYLLKDKKMIRTNNIHLIKKNAR